MKYCMWKLSIIIVKRCLPLWFILSPFGTRTPVSYFKTNLTKAQKPDLWQENQPEQFTAGTDWPLVYFFSFPKEY